MAHELTLGRNGKYEMAFVGETPWHSLGQNVTKGASIGVWAKEAGLDWEALEGTPKIVPDFRGVEINPMVVEFSDFKGLYRSDTLKPLSIVSSGYKPHQPKKLLEFFREFTESGGWHIHTAGSLRGGRKIWVMATCEDAKKFVKGNKDQMVMNLLLATSLDGSMQTTGILTNVRVVCANTLRAALEGSAYGIVKLSHRSDWNAAHIKKALGVESAHQSFDAFLQRARDLADTPINLAEAADVLAKVFDDGRPKQKKEKLNLSWLGADAGPFEDDEEEPQTPELKRSVARVLELFDGEAMGAGLATAAGTRWGLLNAVTQFVDHEMGRSDDTRMDSAWFGRGSGYKDDALKLLTAEV